MAGIRLEGVKPAPAPVVPLITQGIRDKSALLGDAVTRLILVTDAADDPRHSHDFAQVVIEGSAARVIAHNRQEGCRVIGLSALSW